MITEQVVATAILYVFQLIDAGIARNDIIDSVRAKEKEGMSPEEITAYLAALADSSLDKLNAVQPPPGS